MKIWSPYIFHLLFFSILEIDCDGKRICIRKFHTVQNDSFFQRIEVPSPLRCAERCIDNIEYCKAALFIPKENKNRGFCQLYGANSNSSGISLDISFNSISTVFEVLDQCPVTNGYASSGSDLGEAIKLELKQKLESWTDPAQIFQLSKNGGPTRKRTSGPVRPVIDGLISMAQGTFNPSSSPYTNKLLPRANHYPSSLLKNSNTSDNYPPKQSYSFSTNEIQLSSPIKPVSVRHGQQGSIYGRCQGANCYVPSLSYLQKTDYNWPCSVYSLPCESKRPDPCFTTCPQSGISSLSSIPKATLLNEEEWPGSYINKKQPSNKSKQSKELLQSQGVPHGPVQLLSTSMQPTESMVISWSEWSPQTPCSVTCGIGISTRRRFCSVDGQCLGESMKEELCSNAPCPEWKPWSEWTACSRSCDGGERSRSRVCSISQQCDGPSMSIEACNVEKCAQWTAWGSWEVCSVTCGVGQQIRRRQCIGGNRCVEETLEKKACKQLPCPSWSIWEAWSTCSVSCGNGHRHRTRICYDSKNCTGDPEEHEVCIRNSCPQWTDWSSWTQCTETCGTKGNKLRIRTCLKDNLISSLCDGAAQDQIACQDLPECPSWISWSSWSTCSVTCGHGQENRQRSCLPIGAKCIGTESEFRFCQESVCPYWDEWSPWSSCSVTCGSGTRERRRKCVKDGVIKAVAKEGFSSGSDLTNSIKQKVIPLYMSDRSANDQVDIKMQSNTAQRSGNPLMSTNSFVDGNISVVKIIRDNNGCTGNAVDSEQCDAGHCCKLSEWTMWSACSVSCGGGTRERHRKCSQDVPQNYELSRSSYYSKLIRKHIPVGPTPQHKFRPVVFGQYGRSNYERQGLQPIVPVKRLDSLTRTRRQTETVRKFGLFEQDDFVPRTDEFLCDCDGELREENSCAQISCPELSNARTCGWSHWTEWCGYTRSCNQGDRIRTRYCVDGISANDNTSNSNTEKDLCILSECSIGRESGLVTREQSAGPCLYSVQSDFHNLFQHSFRQIMSTVSRDNDMDCLWSSWNSETSCIGGFKTKTRSCIGISTKTKCHCDGKLEEQIVCLCPRLEMVRSNQKVGAAAEFTSLSPLITSKQIAMPEERMTVYPSNFTRASCSWSQWGMWSICSETCGAGKTIRKRFCPCRFCSFGESLEVQFCELMKC